MASDLPALLAGTKTLGTVLEKRRLAHLCLVSNYYRDAARLYRETLKEEPDLVGASTGTDLGSTVRSDAATSMAFAGLGFGFEAKKDMALCAEAAGLLGEEVAMWAAARGRGDPGVETRIENFGRRFRQF